MSKKTKTPEKPILGTSKITITVIHYLDGSSVLNTDLQNVNKVNALGWLEYVKENIKKDLFDK